MSQWRKSKSAAWHKRHERDAHVRRARQDGYRSRAAYKLLEVAAPDGLLAPGMCALDIGAAPGGWSQVLAEKVASGGSGGCVVAVDLLPMEAIAGVRIVRGDFLSAATQAEIERGLPRRADLLVSDMAPDLTGVAATDQARSLALLESLIGYLPRVLAPGGNAVFKAFAGGELASFEALVRRDFKRVKMRRPRATRAGSREVYCVCLSYRRKED